MSRLLCSSADDTVICMAPSLSSPKLGNMDIGESHSSNHEGGSWPLSYSLKLPEPSPGSDGRVVTQ